MKLITTDEQLCALIPHVMATVEGESSLLETLTPFIEQAETWLATNITSAAILEAIAAEENTPIKQLCCRIVANEAFRAAIPSLDLILTPNGFGIVSNSNVIPASRDRVERLMDSLEGSRDQAVEQLLPLLAVHEEWRSTEQGKFFAATLFPTPAVCYQLAIRQHVWDEYQKLHARLIKIENVLAETYFSQELMTVFRTKVMDGLRSCHPLEEHVIRSLQSLEMMLVSDLQVHPQSFYDLVNIIRENDELFPAWHQSSTAQLYSPAAFTNKKKSGGYWF